MRMSTRYDEDEALSRASRDEDFEFVVEVLVVILDINLSTVWEEKYGSVKPCKAL